MMKAPCRNVCVADSVLEQKAKPKTGQETKPQGHERGTHWDYD
jgi:hypothetical protein